jgi:hypothetical protein
VRWTLQPPHPSAKSGWDRGRRSPTPTGFESAQRDNRSIVQYTAVHAISMEAGTTPHPQELRAGSQFRKTTTTNDAPPESRTSTPFSHGVTSARSCAATGSPSQSAYGNFQENDPYVLAREGIFAASIVILFLLAGLIVLVVRTASLPRAMQMLSTKPPCEFETKVMAPQKCGFPTCSLNTC